MDFFIRSGWNPLRVLVVAACAYPLLVLLLRISGKRTLSKMNAFDLVVTVALGSTLSTLLIDEQTSLLEGVTAFVALICLQFVVTWLAVRSRHFARAIKATPTLLYFRGAFLDAALEKERITRGELRAAAREKGLRSLEEVEAIVLETAGELSVIPKGAGGQPSLLEELQRSEGSAPG